MVNHTYHHVPYYHYLYKKLGIKPSKIKSVSDLKKLPPISKNDLKQNWKNFISNTINPKKCKTFSTSGTTGLPLKIIKDKVTIAIECAMIYYAFFECGMKLTDRYLEISTTFPSGKCMFRHGPGGLMKGFFLSALNNPIKNINQILKITPTTMYAFSTMFELILEDFGSKLENISPRRVFTQGEKLSDKQKKLVEACWGIKCNETYGSVEFPRLAFECNKHQGLHVLNDQVVELIKDEENVAPNEEGETIITSLYNFAMPLIRYRLGDLAKWSEDKCPCGRNLPLLKSIEGRIASIIILPSGRRILGNSIIPVIKTAMGQYFKRYQVIFQQSKAHFIIKLVCSENIQGKDRTFLNQQIISIVKHVCLDEDVTIEVNFLDSILPLQSGKIPDLIVET